jgi:hypothetical protein
MVMCKRCGNEVPERQSLGVGYAIAIGCDGSRSPTIALHECITLHSVTLLGLVQVLVGSGNCKLTI